MALFALVLFRFVRQLGHAHAAGQPGQRVRLMTVIIMTTAEIIIINIRPRVKHEFLYATDGTVAC